MIVRLHFLAHVIILVLDFNGSCSCSIFLVDEIHAFAHISLLLLVKAHVVIADDV